MPQMKHPAENQSALPRRHGEQQGIARRDFLKLAGAGTVAAAVASAAVAHAVSGAWRSARMSFRSRDRNLLRCRCAGCARSGAR